jgi:hypothetical protein
MRAGTIYREMGEPMKNDVSENHKKARTGEEKARTEKAKKT